jgi:hypothetical protein
MQLEEAVDAYLLEWMNGRPPVNATAGWYREALKSDHATLEPLTRAWNLISAKGSASLWSASRLLLQGMGEQRRVGLQTARRCLIEAHAAHLPKADRTRRLSEHAVIAGATKRLATCARENGIYAIPVQFAPSAKNTRFRIGPAVIMSKEIFDAEFRAAVAAEAGGTEAFGKKAAAEWAKYSERYDHFIVVEVLGHEPEMAWKAARELAEYVLNLIRIKFGFYHMDDVRVGNGFVWETSQVQLYFDQAGAANFSLSHGPWASHLKDDWVEHFDDDVGGSAPLLASLALWMASGNDPQSPVLERLRYGNALIAEAFSEPHDRIRLVRLVSALEALAVLPNEKKANSLAWRCAFAGGWTDCGKAVQIVDDVLNAYSVRNAVVHGDSPNNDDAISAFHRLERHLASIYIGFLQLHAKVQRRYRPTHVRHIRQAFDKHIEFFFWDPDEIW